MKRLLLFGEQSSFSPLPSFASQNPKTIVTLGPMPVVLKALISGPKETGTTGMRKNGANPVQFRNRYYEPINFNHSVNEPGGETTPDHRTHVDAGHTSGATGTFSSTPAVATQPLTRSVLATMTKAIMHIAINDN